MKLETKYNYGDDVWFMYDNRPTKCQVTNFFVDCNYKGGSDSGWGNKTYPIIITYKFSIKDMLVTHFESSIFPTKEELLKSL